MGGIQHTLLLPESQKSPQVFQKCPNSCVLLGKGGIGQSHHFYGLSGACTAYSVVKWGCTGGIRRTLSLPDSQKSPQVFQNVPTHVYYLGEGDIGQFHHFYGRSGAHAAFSVVKHGHMSGI